MKIILRWDMSKPVDKKMDSVELRADTEEEKVALADFYLNLRLRGEATLKVDKLTQWKRAS